MVQKLTFLKSHLNLGIQEIFLSYCLRLWEMLNSVFAFKHKQCLDNMIQIGFNKIMLKIKGYTKENWGSPFIVGFMLLLVVAAVSQFAGLPSFGDTVAVYAYYALIAGVFLQLASFLKYRGKTDEKVAV